MRIVGCTKMSAPSEHSSERPESAGFGVSYGVGGAGERVPLLMYADDIVLLASTPEQLQRMLAVVERRVHSRRTRFVAARGTPR